MKYRILSICLLLFVCSALLPAETVRTTRKNNYVREGPGSYYELVTVVPENTALELLDKSGTWVKVKLSGDKTGWVAANSITQRRTAGTPGTPVETVMASPKASRAGIAAAIKGFGEKYSGTSDTNVNRVVTLGEKVFTPEDLAAFTAELRQQPSANRTKATWESLGMRSLRTDPRLTDQSVGLSLASRIAARGLSDNAVLHHYVNLIAANLAASTPLYDWDFNVYLLNDTKSQGYAIPGGYLFLTTGAVEECADEAELAARIGHEIGALLYAFMLPEDIEKTTLSVIDEAFSELDEEVEKMEEERSGVEAFVDKTYKKVIAPRSLKTMMDADRVSAVLCAAAGYDPFAVVRMVEKAGGEDQENMEAGINAKKRLDAIKNFCNRRFVKQTPGALMAERFEQNAGKGK
jgi:beta-barrel assembly-enhancing protease